MTVIVAGVFRVPPENIAAMKPRMLTVMKATRAEPGCEVYSYAEDVKEPGLFRVFEVWTDQASLDAHVTTPHMKAWVEARAGLGLFGRDISFYTVSGQRKA